MLTDEEKGKIKAEEIFRDEIRKELSEKVGKSFRNKIWTFMNSSLGIWLLSTVVVGLIVYFYNNNKLENELSANNAATIQKLETETSNRLQQFKSALLCQDPSKIYYQKDELAYMIDGILVSDGSLSLQKPIYIFPEYKERTMNSLLYEIGRLTRDKKQILIIGEARTILSKIQNTLLKMDDPPRYEFPISQMLERKLQIRQPLSSDEKKQLKENQQREKTFNEAPWLKYNNLIKKKLSELLILFESNSVLKELSEK
jgi:hypothetical protein